MKANEILKEMAKTARVEQMDAIHAVLDLIASIQVEDASTNPDDDEPSLPVYGNVDVRTLVALGLWSAGKQIVRRAAPPTW